MNNDVETVATRLWRDRVLTREQERDAAEARARIAEQKVAILMAENDRLAAENARMRSLLEPAGERDETALQMEAIKGALLPLLTEQGRAVN